MNPFPFIRRPIGTFLEWVSLKLSCLERIDGVVICDCTPTQPFKDAFLELTRQALALIKSLDARRYRRVCRYLHYIANTALLSRGQYGRTLKTCRVDYEKNFNSTQPQMNVREYAGTLIHEATHGLLFDKGIPYDKETRERIERLCHLEVYRFARRLQPGYADSFSSRYNPESYRRYWESSFQSKRQSWRKSLQEAWKSSFPKTAQDYQQLGRLHTRMGKYDNAIAACDKALQLDPQFAKGYFSRGAAYLKKRNYEKAILDYDTGIQLNPNDAVAYNNRGTAYLRKRDYGRVIADYDRAVHLDPHFAIAHQNLAWVLATCPQAGFRDGKKALEYAMKACLLSAWKDPEAVKTLAAACGETGDFEQAVQWQSQYLRTPNLTNTAREAADHTLTLYQSQKPYPTITP